MTAHSCTGTNDRSYSCADVSTADVQIRSISRVIKVEVLPANHPSPAVCSGVFSAGVQLTFLLRYKLLWQSSSFNYSFNLMLRGTNSNIFRWWILELSDWHPEQNTSKKSEMSDLTQSQGVPVSLPPFSLLIHLGEQLVWIQSCEPQIKTDIWWGQVCLFHPACKYAKLSNFPKYKNLLPEKERVLSLSIKSRLYVCRFSFACSVCCCNSSPVIFSLSYLFGCHL